MNVKELAAQQAKERTLKKAAQALELAGDALQESTAAAFPVGGIVSVKLGGGRGRERSRIEGVILHAGADFGTRDTVLIRNLKSGKERRFSASWHGHGATLMHLPKKGKN